MTKEEKLLRLLDQLPEKMLAEALEPPAAPSRRHWRRLAALAACLGLAVGLGLGAGQLPEGSGVSPAQTAIGSAPVETGSVGLLPAVVITPAPPLGSDTYQEQALRFAMLPLGGRVAEYHQVPRPDRILSLGDPYEGLEGWYRPAGTENLQYLIREEAEGYTLWEFASFLVWEAEEAAAVRADISSGTSLWGTLGWFDPDTLDFSPYPYSLVLEQVYGVTSAADICSITISPADMDNTDSGKALQAEIGTRVLTDPEGMALLYETLCSMTCLGGDRWAQIDRGEGDNPDGGGLLEAVRLGRYLTLELANGESITSLKYTAAGGQFYEYGGVAYTPLERKTAAQISRLLGIF